MYVGVITGHCLDFIRTWIWSTHCSKSHQYQSHKYLSSGRRVVPWE